MTTPVHAHAVATAAAAHECTCGETFETQAALLDHVVDRRDERTPYYRRGDA